MVDILTGSLELAVELTHLDHCILGCMLFLGVKQQMCGVCNKVFADRQLLALHLVQHQDDFRKTGLFIKKKKKKKKKKI